jgi:hypothetical protein
MMMMMIIIIITINRWKVVTIKEIKYGNMGVGIAQLVQQQAMGWTARV